ncbi:MAG: hypothetical protein WBI62_08830, partial [Sedimentibacter sp.]
MKTLIKNIKIITMDDEKPLIDCGDIIIEDDRILDIIENGVSECNRIVGDPKDECYESTSG